jgi:hypothetical protein
MSEPFEQKYKQAKKDLLILRAQYRELEKRSAEKVTKEIELFRQLTIARTVLFGLGWRMVDNKYWTNEPLEHDDE